MTREQAHAQQEGAHGNSRSLPSNLPTRDLESGLYNFRPSNQEAKSEECGDINSFDSSVSHSALLKGPSESDQQRPGFRHRDFHPWPLRVSFRSSKML
jgi:hypothetical protein